MRESRTYGSARGASSDGRSYREGGQGQQADDHSREGHENLQQPARRAFARAAWHGEGAERRPDRRQWRRGRSQPRLSSAYIEFTKAGAFISRFNIDPDIGGAFGIDAGLVASLDNAPRLAVVDDNTNTLNVSTGLPPSISGAEQ